MRRLNVAYVLLFEFHIVWALGAQTKSFILFEIFPFCTRSHWNCDRIAMSRNRLGILITHNGKFYLECGDRLWFFFLLLFKLRYSINIYRFFLPIRVLVLNSWLHASTVIQLLYTVYSTEATIYYCTSKCRGIQVALFFPNFKGCRTRRWWECTEYNLPFLFLSLITQRSTRKSTGHKRYVALDAIDAIAQSASSSGCFQSDFGWNLRRCGSCRSTTTPPPHATG